MKPLLCLLRRVGFYARQEKKGISNEVMHLVNMKFEEKKKSEGFNMLVKQCYKILPCCICFMLVEADKWMRLH